MTIQTDTITTGDITFPDCRDTDFTWTPDEERLRRTIQIITLAIQYSSYFKSLEDVLSDFLKSLHVKHAFFVGDKLTVDFDGTV